jgi:hypothetical protein
VEALLVVDAKGGCTTVYYEAQNPFLECERVKLGY